MKTNKEIAKYYLQMLDNGIVLSSLDTDYSECEKYGEDNDFTDVYKFLGRALWSDIIASSESLLATDMKITFSFEKKQ